MKKINNRRIEIFLLVTFPMALFVGCAGNGGPKPNAANEFQTEQGPAIAALEQSQPVSTAPYEAHLLIDILKKERDATQNTVHEPLFAEDKAEVTAENLDDVDIQDTATNTTAQETLQITWLNEQENTIQSANEKAGSKSIVGHTMDVKFSEFKQPQMNIINFASGDTDIDMSYLVTLQQHAKFLQQHPGLLLTVSGHSDSVGSEATNLKLSEQRARNVFNILLSYGAPEAQLVIDAFGESSPLNDINNYEENRRVELEYSDEVLLSSR